MRKLPRSLPLAAALLVCLVSCWAKQLQLDPSITSRTYQLSFFPSPLNMTPQALEDRWAVIAHLGAEMVMIAEEVWVKDDTPPYPPTDLSQSILMAQKAREYGLKVFLGLQPYDGDRAYPGDGRGNFYSPETVAEFLQVVENAMRNIGPEYLDIGIEMNIFYRSNPYQWPNYLSLYQRGYERVKELNVELGLDTKVLVSFMYEYAQVFGQPLQTILSHFTSDGRDVDLFGISTYPNTKTAYQGITFDPSKLPLDYYSQLTAYTSKPLAITETGYQHIEKQGSTNPCQWIDFHSDEVHQNNFVAVLADRVKDMNLEFINWMFLHDWPDDAVPCKPDFFKMGLVYQDRDPETGEIDPKGYLALDLWKQVRALPLVGGNQ